MDFSKTILGTPYREDDRVLLIAQFISEHLTSPGVEIEAKVGYIRSLDSFPAFSHIIELDLKKFGGRFESSLQPLMFKSLLETLKSLHKEYRYEETEDSLYTLRGQQDAKIRETIGKNNKVMSLIKKSKIADKNFLLSTLGIGIRISANYEETLTDIPEGSKFSVIRKKKRHAFRYQYLEIDLTEVNMNNKISYELEIEIIDFNFVKTHVDSYVLGADKGNLIGIARKIWQNALTLAFHRPKAVVARVEESKEFVEDREKAYNEFIGTVKPVIGDYLYCISKEKQNADLVT
jgi:mRNA capping enzyme, beta chain